MNPLEISSSQFRRLADQVTQFAADYLENIDAKPICPATTGAETERIFRTPLPMEGLGEKALAGLEEVISRVKALDMDDVRRQVQERDARAAS